MMNDKMNNTTRTLTDDTTLTDVYYTLSEGSTSFVVSPSFLLDLIRQPSKH